MGPRIGLHALEEIKISNIGVGDYVVFLRIKGVSFAHLNHLVVDPVI